MAKRGMEPSELEAAIDDRARQLVFDLLSGAAGIEVVPLPGNDSVVDQVGGVAKFNGCVIRLRPKL